jgi:cystathionine beta-synthase
MIHSSVLDQVGNTPLVRLNTIPGPGAAEVVAKVEAYNPGGSVKDRIGIRIIDDAEKRGVLKPGGTIVEATSGNTGAGLALVCIQRGYKSIFVMPDKMSVEKIRYLKALGAEVVTCPTAVEPEDPRSYYSVSRRLSEETPNAILANQYHNPVNPQTHYEWTGPEIWEQTEGQLDFFIAGMGTGGTISGCSKYLKEKNPNIKVVGVDIEGSILHHYFCTGEMAEAHTYLIEGIGEDFIPGTTDMSAIDEIVTVTDKESFITARRLSREEGLFVGGSSGSAVAGAVKIAQREGPGKRIIVLLPDHGNRYLSTFHGDEWMRERGLVDPDQMTVRDVLRQKPPGPPTLVSVSPNATVREALERMHHENVSQVPVIDGGKSVGSLEDGATMTRVLENTGMLDRKVADVMSDPFPTVRDDEPMQAALTPLTKRQAAVLVMSNGDAAGLLTRFDFLQFLQAK